MTGSPPPPSSARARRSAKHSVDLLGAPPAIDELVPALSFLGEKLVRLLPAPLARVTGGEPPVVRIGMPMDCTLGAIQSEIETLAMHSLIVLGPKALPVLATCEAPPLFRLVDRAYGGRGAVPDPLPEAFPLSAELLLSRIEGALAEALAGALAGAQGPTGEANTDERLAVRSQRRDTSLRQLDPFARHTELLRIVIDIEEPDSAGDTSEPWSLALAFPLATLAEVLPAPKRPRRRPGPRRTVPPHAEPFASMPIELTAVLVDMPMSMRRLSLLRPGDVLPVAVARAVPLQVDGRTIATGSVGELDDRIAVQLGQAF